MPYGDWWHRSGSPLVQVMACCLTASSHYLKQCWLITLGELWHSSSAENNFTAGAKGMSLGWLAQTNYDELMTHHTTENIRVMYISCGSGPAHMGNQCNVYVVPMVVLIQTTAQVVPNLTPTHPQPDTLHSCSTRRFHTLLAKVIQTVCTSPSVRGSATDCQWALKTVEIPTGHVGPWCNATYSKFSAGEVSLKLYLDQPITEWAMCHILPTVPTTPW